MPSAKPVPWPRSYWVVPERLLAGAYPGHPDPVTAEARVRQLVGAGIRTFVDLTEAEEQHHGRRLMPYDAALSRVAREQGVAARWLRLPIADLSAPTPGRMTEIQHAIDGSLEAGQPVYVHCLGGRGRTGTVVGAWLVSHGHATRSSFVQVIADLRAADASGGNAPETDAQRAFVVRWAER